VTREELVTLVRDALEASDVCCQAGSPRGISNVYDYIPTVDAAEIAVDALLGTGELAANRG